MSDASPVSAENLAHVRDRIERAASRSGRRADEITIVAVSKTHPTERIRELYRLGIRHFGENRVQEWESKLAALADLDITWHMIGHLQSNKAARVARQIHSVDSVDAISLADLLDRASGEENLLRVLIEVKLDPEPAKSGVRAEELPGLVEAVLLCPHLDLHGLMGVPPYIDDPEKVRPYFSSLREIRDGLRAKLGRELLPVLSMGMSHDFEVAIEEGATEIRVGTALFGGRPKE